MKKRKKKGPIGYWAVKLNCIKAALECNSIGEFCIKYSGAAKYVYKMRWQDAVFGHMKRKNVKLGHWLIKDNCIKAALRYTNISAFQKKHSRAYNVIKLNHWDKEAYEHMQKPKNNNIYWTKEKCLQEALKHSTKHSFFMGCRKAYAAAHAKGFLPEICDHMTKWIRTDFTRKNPKKELPNPHCIVNGIEHKCCKKCGSVQPLTDFHNSKYHRGGKDNACKKCNNNKNKIKYLAYPERYREASIKSRNKNIDVYRKKEREMSKFKKQTDVNFRLSGNFRNIIQSHITRQKTKQYSKSKELLGCTPSEARLHLESLFTENMSWENYGFGKGKWNIDHIRPCASFNLAEPEQQKQCFNYTNLQPLWFFDNVSKGSNYNGIKYKHNGKHVKSYNQR